MYGTTGPQAAPRTPAPVLVAPPVADPEPAPQPRAPELVRVEDLRPADERKPWPQVPHGAVYAPGAPGADENGMLAFPGLVPRSIVDAILCRAPTRAAQAETERAAERRQTYAQITDLRR
jgi:hypothetical protein